MAEDPRDQVPIPAVGVPVPVPLPDSLPLPATSAQVAQFVAYRAAACVGADYANLALLDDARTSLRLFHDSFLDPDIADRYTDVAVDATYPIAAAVREERVVLLSGIESYRVQFPDIVADTIAAGVRASASLPLYRSDGTVLGALAFAWTDPTVFTGPHTYEYRFNRMPPDYDGRLGSGCDPYDEDRVTFLGRMKPEGRP